MFLSQVTFGAPTVGETDEAFDCVDSYLIQLQKNGQISGDWLRSVVNGSVTAFVDLIRPNAAEVQHHSRYGIEERAACRELFGCEPKVDVLTDHVPTKFLEAEDCRSFCFFASEYDGDSPVCDLETSDRFPSFLIDMNDDERERLYFWSREYNRMDGIWFSSGDLEVAAYEQLASPDSMLAQEGRELASLVESVLKKPVYYFLMRHYACEQNENDRHCPGCGTAWRTDAPDDASFWSFHFLCTKCRLVSNLGVAEYDEAFAGIGDFQRQ